MKKFLFLTCFLMAMSISFARADEQEMEIQLVEVVESGIIIGDDPLGNPTQNGETPTRPTDFRATISGRTLAVNVDNANSTQVIVRNSAGNAVVSTSFYGFTAEQITNSGSYTIEIYNGGMKLVGQFNVQ